MINSKCTICRRQGAKLFLKGERCFSAKCQMVKRPYSPGLKRKRRTGGLSEFGFELKEKQKLKNLYDLRERQFKNYVKTILIKKGLKEDAASLLLKKLESRLDNVVFRLGFAISRRQARQLVSHGYILINKRKVNVPSYRVKKGDIISIAPQKLEKKVFQNLKIALKKYQPQGWLELDKEKLEGKVVGLPSLDESAPPAEISAIFEFYSK